MWPLHIAPQCILRHPLTSGRSSFSGRIVGCRWRVLTWRHCLDVTSMPVIILPLKHASIIATLASRSTWGRSSLPFGPLLRIWHWLFRYLYGSFSADQHRMPQHTDLSPQVAIARHGELKYVVQASVLRAHTDCKEN